MYPAQGLSSSVPSVIIGNLSVNGRGKRQKIDLWLGLASSSLPLRFLSCLLLLLLVYIEESSKVGCTRVFCHNVINTFINKNNYICCMSPICFHSGL